MSKYIFFVGDDYECSNKEYVALPTDKGQQITVALTASGVPFKGSFDKNSFVFDYDGDYKESVDEIIENYTSDKYADIRRDVEEHRRDKDYLFFIPAVAKLLRMTEGTLRNRPLDIQLAVCKRYADYWGCDTYTMLHELKDVLSLTTKPEPNIK
ncbi:MAG: hypothetical protein IJ740_09150 [Ruminococcus sp.]|nr:hypothetical protein [Ruminococcus sp.]